MTQDQLHETILIAVKNVNPNYVFTEIQDAILEEMCDHVINSKTIDHSNAAEMISVSLNSYDASYQLVRAMITGIIDSGGKLKMNFRGRDFCFDKDNKQF